MTQDIYDQQKVIPPHPSCITLHRDRHLSNSTVETSSNESIGTSAVETGLNESIGTSTDETGLIAVRPEHTVLIISNPPATDLGLSVCTRHPYCKCAIFCTCYICIFVVALIIIISTVNSSDIGTFIGSLFGLMTICAYPFYYVCRKYW